MTHISKPAIVRQMDPMRSPQHLREIDDPFGQIPGIKGDFRDVERGKQLQQGTGDVISRKVKFQVKGSWHPCSVQTDGGGRLPAHQEGDRLRAIVLQI